MVVKVRNCEPKLVLSRQGVERVLMVQVGLLANRLLKVLCWVELMVMLELAGRGVLLSRNVPLELSPT